MQKREGVRNTPPHPNTNRNHPHPNIEQGSFYHTRLINKSMCKQVIKHFATYKVGGRWMRTGSHLDKRALMRELWPVIEKHDNLEVTFQVERSYVSEGE